MLCLRRIEGKERKGGEGKGWDEEEAKVLREKNEEKSLAVRVISSFLRGVLFRGKFVILRTNLHLRPSSMLYYI